MADGNDLYTWCNNNYFNYVGSLGPYPMSKIKELVLSGDAILNYFSTHKKRPDGFAAYPQEMREINFEPNHLFKLGFQLNSSGKVFTLGSTAVIHFSYIDGDDPLHMHLYGPAMWIFKSEAAVPQHPSQVTKEYIFANAVEVAALHAFQNYCTYSSINIDFSMLE